MTIIVANTGSLLESEVEDILHPIRDIQSVRPVGLKEYSPKNTQSGFRVLSSCFGVSQVFSPSALSALSSNTIKSLINLNNLHNSSVN